MRGGRLARRRHRAERRLRHGGPGARCPAAARFHLRSRAPSPSSSPRRRCCCSRSRASSRSTTRCASTFPELPDYGTPLTIRHMLNHTSGLRDWGSVGGHRRLAAHHARLHPRARARHPEPTARAQLSAGRGVLVQQQRLQPGGHPGGARRRQAVRRIHPRSHFHTARHDFHFLARRLPPHREGPRHRLLGERRHGPPAHAV